MYLIDWESCKQLRVCYSLCGAEIVACTDAQDRGSFVKTALRSIRGIEPKHIPVVDLKG